MTIFDEAKKILNQEIESYQKMFDTANADKVSKTSESYKNDKEKFDNELISGINDFNIEYTTKVSDLKKHIDDKIYINYRILYINSYR